MSNDSLIKELDFVLTHPSCNVEHLERFYNDYLYINKTVPLFEIVTYMRKRRPELLKVWSIENKVVGRLLGEMESLNDESKINKQQEIEIVINISFLRETSVKTYVYTWETKLDSSLIDQIFKEQKFKIVCSEVSNLIVTGIKHEKMGSYTLYLKKRER
ncbi:hypothetical protein JI735_33870 (plasmid) [Paenibacillus sonchi]|uniref:Uncharacterized protein n=1 Tax=Paenibacillus sonchi TaxID=373687 RepID=A0A974PJH7_9BACL|nr:hypothetical protein [Paenibacillus sonchi]QQZ64638.1 hypothetical protein JI735_33870 [Paenibacillus sonchi]